MPDITASQVHINRHISNLLIAYRPENLIADMVFPVVSVNKQTDNYAILDKSNWLRLPTTTNRAPGEGAKQVNFSVSSDSYNAKNYALSELVDYETQANADTPLDPLTDAAFHLRDQLSIDFEVRVRSKIVTGVGTTITVASAWNGGTGTDPAADVDIARQAIYSTTGKYPNTAVIGQKAWQALKHNPNVVNAVYPGGGGGGTVTIDQLASFLEVERVLVGRTVYNSAAEGLADSFTDVWSTNLSLLYVTPRPALRSATFGLAFNWNGGKLQTGVPTNWNVMQEELRFQGATRIWTGYYQDEKVIAPELGANIATGIT